MPLFTSPPIQVADTSAHAFDAVGRESVAVMLTFYMDQGGQQSAPPWIGSRTVTVRRRDVARLEDADVDLAVVGDMPDNVIVLRANAWVPLALGTGFSALELSAADGDDPAGAMSYRYTFSTGEILGNLDAPQRVISEPGAPLEVEQVRDLDLDLVRGQGSHPAFGQRLNIPNSSTVDVWAGAATVRPLPLGPKPMFIVSTSAGDTFGVGGAQLAVVSFIDESGDWRNSDLLPMAGLTQVPITFKPTDGVLGNASNPPTPPSPPDGSSQTASIFRVIDATVIAAAGATEATPRVNNLGTLRVVDGSATVFEAVPAGFGRSLSAAFHCPRGYTARVTYAPIGTSRGQGTAYIGITFGLGLAWVIVPIAAVDGATALFDADSAVTAIAERGDVQAIIMTASNSIDVSFTMQFRLVPNEVTP